METLAEKILEHGVVALIAVALLYWILRVQSQTMREGFHNLRIETAMQTAANLSVVNTLHTFQQMFLVHHATVFGINPSLGKDEAEREGLAVKQFNEVKTMLEVQREQVSKSVRVIDKYLENLISKEGISLDILSALKK